MRVLLTTDTVGGVWTFTRVLATELLQRGHAVALVSFGRAPSADQRGWCERTGDRFAEFVFEACEIPLEWMTHNERAYEDGVEVLRRVAASFVPDVVHSSQFCYGDLPIGMPVVVTAHSDVLSWGSACRAHGLESSEWLTRYCLLVERGLSAADAVVAPTRWMLDALQENFAFTAGQHVVCNGVSLPVWKDGERRMQAVSAGRFWDEAKNLSLLARVKTSMPMLVAGDQEYDGAVSADLGTVKALGGLSEEVLLTLFRESAVYVAPSVYEPFGLAPLEAAQCGCALLLNDLASFREVWGESAVYFRGDAALGELLDGIVCGDVDLARLQAMAGKRAREMTAERMTEGYLEVYALLIQQSAERTETVGAYAG